MSKIPTVAFHHVLEAGNSFLAVRLDVGPGTGGRPNPSEGETMATLSIFGVQGGLEHPITLTRSQLMQHINACTAAIAAHDLRLQPIFEGDDGVGAEE